MQEILLSRGAIVLTAHEAVQVVSCPTGNGVQAIIGPDGKTRNIVSERLVLATGAEQRIDDIAAEQIGHRALMPALADRIMLSGEALAHGGAARIAMRLADCRDPKVAIIGGSHSALGCANLLLGKDTGIAFAKGALSLLHRRPLRIFYPSTEAALADGYTEFNLADVCPVTHRLFRLSGLRLESGQLAKQLLGIGGAPPEPRLALRPLTDVGAGLEGWRILHEADLVIAALGYRPRGLRLLDSNGHAIPLAALATRRAALVDRECRVIDQSLNPVPGVFALGLAAGIRPWGAMGGEPSFVGQTNGLWLWQNDIGAIIMRSCLGERLVARRTRETNRLDVALSAPPVACRLLAARAHPGVRKPHRRFCSRQLHALAQARWRKAADKHQRRVPPRIAGPRRAGRPPRRSSPPTHRPPGRRSSSTSPGRARSKHTTGKPAANASATTIPAGSRRLGNNSTWWSR